MTKRNGIIFMEQVDVLKLDTKHVLCCTVASTLQVIMTWISSFLAVRHDQSMQHNTSKKILGLILIKKINNKRF